MVIYIPIAFMKDQICNILKKRASKKRQGMSDDVHPGLGSPLKYIGGQKIFEIEIQGHMNRKDSDVDLSEHDEGKPLVSRQGDDARSIRPEKEVTAKEIATYGFYLAPLWFITEVTPLLHIYDWVSFHSYVDPDVALSFSISRMLLLHVQVLQVQPCYPPLRDCLLSLSEHSWAKIP